MPRSTWQRVRLVLNPAVMQASHIVSLSNEEFGTFIRLASYGLFVGLPTNPSEMTRFAGCISTRRLKKIWPKIQQYFQLSPDGKHWQTLEMDWLVPQIVSADRRNLTALLDALVDYWGPRCVYCGSEGALEVEHIVPLARGGTNELTNLTVACRTCNAEKRTKTAEEFGHPEVHQQAKRIQ